MEQASVCVQVGINTRTPLLPALWCTFGLQILGRFPQQCYAGEMWENGGSGSPGRPVGKGPCGGGRMKQGLRSALRKPTVRETEGGNSSFFQCDSNSEEQVCRDILTDMPHPPLPSLQSPLLSGSPSPSSCKKALGPHAALSPSESRQHQFLLVSTVVTALAHYQLTQRV